MEQQEIPTTTLQKLRVEWKQWYSWLAWTIIMWKFTRFLFSGCFIQYSYSKWRLKAMRNEKKSILRAV